MADVMTVSSVVDHDEVESLAQELAAAYARRVAFYRTGYKLELAEAQERADIRQDPAFRQRALTDPPDQVSYSALADLAALDPAQAAAAWKRVKAEAQNELMSGHRAARVMELPGFAGHGSVRSSWPFAPRFWTSGDRRMAGSGC